MNEALSLHLSANVLKHLFISVLLLLSFVSYSQLDTYLSYDIGVPRDQFETNSTLGDVDYRISRMGVPGLRLTQQVYRQVHVEVGAYIDFFALDMLTDSANVFFAQNQIHIPVRLQFVQPLFNKRIQLTASAGINSVFGWSAPYSYELSSVNTNYHKRTQEFSFIDSQLLLEWGLGADIYLTKNFYLGARYYANYGTRNVLTIQAELLNDNTVEANYSVKSHGSYTFFAISMGYRFSRFWNNED